MQSFVSVHSWVIGGVAFCTIDGFVTREKKREDLEKELRVGSVEREREKEKIAAGRSAGPGGRERGASE